VTGERDMVMRDGGRETSALATLGAWMEWSETNVRRVGQTKAAGLGNNRQTGVPQY
jgi:hypothetical protein